MKPTRFVSCIVVVVLISNVNCEWSEEEFLRFERDLSQLADSYLPFETQPSLAQSQHSSDDKGTEKLALKVMHGRPQTFFPGEGGKIILLA